MRLYLIFLLFVSACFAGCELGEVKNNTTASQTSYNLKQLKRIDGHPLLFYNVENLFDTIDDPTTNDDEFTPQGSLKWNSARYSQKLQNLSKVITSASPRNPFIIGLCEIENNSVIEDLIKTDRLDSTKYQIVHFDSPDRRGIDVALIYDSERFIALHEEAICVQLSEDKDFLTRDILYVKGVVQDSSILHVFVNHWPSRRGGAEKSESKRIAAASVVKKKKDSILLTDPNANIIIMGDFNDYPDNRSINEILNAKAPGKAGKEDFVNLMAPYHNMGKGTHNFRGKWGTLDQMIISPSLTERNNLLVKDLKAEILYADFLLYTYPNGEKTPSKTYGGTNYYGGYSDHLAVFLYLTNNKK
ncbi:MAG: hypothetical protein R3277_00665 [Brumimicrobium sp.]|nr:hypothetical protein [Brumimicrobium sp.]